MSVLLYPNPTKDHDLCVTREAAAILRGFGVPLFLPAQFAGMLDAQGIAFLPEAQCFSAPDQVVTIGGDGTLLRAGVFCMEHGKAVLGVNLGRTGFLATCEVSELADKLTRLAKGEYSLDQRSLLHADIPSHTWQQDAMNDVVVRGVSPLHPMDYSVFCDDVLVGHYRSDGVIVASPTGSTAYSLSAGGPIIDVQTEAMVLTPVCAHSTGATPLVFAASRRLRIQCAAENRDRVTVCADSQTPFLLEAGESVEVTTATQKLTLITFDKAEQFHAIENKLTRR